MTRNKMKSNGGRGGCDLHTEMYPTVAQIYGGITDDIAGGELERGGGDGNG